jgi:hypothetical protein
MEIVNQDTIRTNNNNQLCNICKKVYIEPVRCTSCKSLFCQKCCKNRENCPICDFYPFKVIKKQSFDKFRKAIKLMKIYKYAVQIKCNCFCSLCNFKSTEDYFIKHLIEEHKEIAIDVFNKKKINSNKQRLLTQIFNQS